MTLLNPPLVWGPKRPFATMARTLEPAPEHHDGGAADERPYLAGGAASLMR